MDSSPFHRKLFNHIVYLENILSHCPFLLPIENDDSHLVTTWDSYSAMPCSSTHDSTKLLLSLDNHQSGMRRRNDDQVAQNMSSSLTKYDWDIIQSIDNNEMLSFTQKVMWKNWLIDLKTRWSDTVHHYMSLMLEELKQQRRFRTITEEEVQSWIHPMMQTFENIWNIIRQMMNDWNRMKPLTAMVRQSDVKTILFDWFLQHAFEPYPSEEEKEWLAIQTGWTAQQVNHWFINTRVRIWRPIIAQVQQEMSKQTMPYQFGNK